MRSSQRYVFDTNTLVSAALFENGKPGRAFRHAVQSGTVLLSQPTFEEIDEVLAREKFDDYLSLEDRAAFIEALVERGRFADPSKKVQACRDSDDEKGEVRRGCRSNGRAGAEARGGREGCAILERKRRGGITTRCN